MNVRKEAPDKGPVPAYLLDRYCLFLCVCVCVCVCVCLFEHKADHTLGNFVASNMKNLCNRNRAAF